MNKKMLVITVLVSSLFLGGCSLNQRLSQKAGDEAAEKIIESQTGSKVEINSNNQEVVVKTEDGQSAYSSAGEAKLPDNFPKDLILADDAKIMMTSTANQGTLVTYLTNNSQVDMVAKYKTVLASGWKKTMEVDAETGKMLSFSKTGQTLMVIISENNSENKSAKTMVNLTLTAEDSE